MNMFKVGLIALTMVLMGTVANAQSGNTYIRNQIATKFLYASPRSGDNTIIRGTDQSIYRSESLFNETVRVVKGWSNIPVKDYALANADEEYDVVTVGFIYLNKTISVQITCHGGTRVFRGSIYGLDTESFTVIEYPSKYFGAVQYIANKFGGLKAYRYEYIKED